MTATKATCFRPGGLALAFGAALALSGCQTLTEEQCAVTDWRNLGVSDGFAGRNQSYVSRHREACARYGVTADEPAWRSGWEQGVRRHCAPLNGLDHGLRGGAASGDCPAGLAGGYRAAYDVGRKAYRAHREVERLRDELDMAFVALAGTAPEYRASRRLAILSKRNELFAAEARARRADRAADRYRAGLQAAN